jgi:hypothetical protein
LEKGPGQAFDVVHHPTAHGHSEQLVQKAKVAQVLPICGGYCVRIADDGSEFDEQQRQLQAACGIAESMAIP